MQYQKNWPILILNPRLPKKKDFEILLGKLRIIWLFNVKLFYLLTLATPVDRLDKVAQILLWHENAKVAIVPTLQVTFMVFQKFFLFRIAGMISQAWCVKLEQGNYFVFKKHYVQHWKIHDGKSFLNKNILPQYSIEKHFILFLLAILFDLGKIWRLLLTFQIEKLNKVN